MSGVRAYRSELGEYAFENVNHSVHLNRQVYQRTMIITQEGGFGFSCDD